ncbi:hypothetical protein OOK31_16675 [Streptomyces sp. NBC_00249]|uniref:hypothetical protein n=1 Tax=Streptomyces sp. NBC_00249 TaxID=2975690 RepID=UPI00225A86F5|nr:hypothetical protein [Streptomyces sp. NBC_00249]MCX5195520.1 hypothetical protein [Streptomyces sp. NBC_00249]
MKLRHVRAVAVFGIAIVALTGARGSHGGSCGGSSHSSGSGSSSSSGGTSGGSNDSSSSSTSGGVSVPGGSSSRDKAERDIRIDGCKLDASGKNLVAKLTVTNSGSLDYKYNITMKFRGDAASTAAANPAQAQVSALTVKAGASQQTEATTPYTGKGNGSEYKECVVVSASKSSL